MEETLQMGFTLEDIFIVVKKRWLLIISFIIIGMGASAAYTYLTYVPIYSTYTTVLLKRQDVNLGMSNSSDYYIREDLLLTFQGIINSKHLREKVEERLGTASLGAITVSADDSSIIRISVTHIDPEVGAEVANTVAEVFRDMIKEMMYDMDSSILDRARVNDYPQGSGAMSQAMIGAVLGGMISVTICFLIEYLDKTLKTEKEITKLLRLPVIGVIVDGFERKRANLSLSTLMNSKSPTMEVYRSLQTNIDFSLLDHQMKTVTITSPGTSEGKSSISANLALTYSQNGKKTLLVDCNLRDPGLHILFNLSNHRGLSHILYLKEEIDEIKQEVSERLDVLTAGPLLPNPIEFLNSKRMIKFIKDTRDKYDMVIFDTPPVGFLTDAALVSAHTDGTLLIVAMGKSETNLTLKAKEQLNQVNANLLGVVMTIMSSQSKPSYHQKFRLERYLYNRRERK